MNALVRSSRAGLTLIELVIAAAIFSVVGYGLAGAVRMGHRSQTMVFEGASANADLRSSAVQLVDELSLASDTSIVVTQLPDGNDQVAFMLPIENGGALDWGVSNYLQGTHVDWTVRYTVQTSALQRQLVRQIVDDAGQVRAQTIVADGLRPGTAVPPGFGVVRSGAMWVLSIATVGNTSDVHGEEVIFHVKTRN